MVSYERTIKRAIYRYNQGGLSTLIKSAYVTSYRKILNSVFLDQIFLRDYHQRIIDSGELRRHGFNSKLWKLPSGKECVFTEYPEVFFPKLFNKKVDVFPSPHYLFRQPFLTESTDITLFGPQPIAFSPEGRIIADTMSFDPYNIVDLNPRIKRAVGKAITESPFITGMLMLGKGEEVSTRTIPLACTLYGGGGMNYYHWIMEHLLKLRGVEYFENQTGKEVRLIIPHNPPQYITESLDILGFNDREIIQYDGSPITIKRLIVPSFPELIPSNLSWLRNNFSEKIQESSESHGWIYISRQGAGKRRVQNYSEVKSVLDQYGIKPIQCENISLREEIKLFQSAEGVIGPHGAGLTAIAWANNIEVIEIFNRVCQPPYNVLSEAIGHNYSALRASPVGSRHNDSNQNMIIDTNELERTIKEKLCDDN